MNPSMCEYMPTLNYFKIIQRYNFTIQARYVGLPPPLPFQGLPGCAETDSNAV